MKKLCTIKSILFSLNLDDELSKEKFIKENIGNKYLIWIVKSQSGWDLIIRLYAQTVEEFKEKLSEILERFSSVLANYYTIISSDTIKETEKEAITRSLFDEEFTNQNDFETIKKDDIISIDSKDKEILKLLEEDARVQYKEIASKLDISSDTVKYRIEKMKSIGVIESFSPVINFNKLGLLQYAAVIKFGFLDKNDEEKICNLIKESKYIVKAIKNLYSEEFFLNLIFEDNKSKENFENEMKSTFKEKISMLEMFKID